MQFTRFVLESIRHPRQVGTITQSSKFLARKMVKEMNGTLNVVEFGSGTGAVTLEILRHLPRNGRLICFEINSKFCKSLEAIEDSRLTVINDDAQNCENYVDRLDCVISGLPLNLFNRTKRDKIITLSSKSKLYIQFQYTPFLLKQMKHHFKDVKIKFVPLNVPPAFLYVCRPYI